VATKTGIETKIETKTEPPGMPCEKVAMRPDAPHLPLIATIQKVNLQGTQL